jgi:hypothetical protein
MRGRASTALQVPEFLRDGYVETFRSGRTDDPVGRHVKRGQGILRLKQPRVPRKHDILGLLGR